MPVDDGSYAIGDLAALAGTTPRTIRYYVAQGLLPAPIGVGPGAHYTDGHLARLRLIRRLQRQHQPLAEIRQQLASLDADQVVALLTQAERPAPRPGDSALDYVRSILGSPSIEANEGAPVPPVASAPAAAPAQPTSVPMARALPTPGGPSGPARLLRSFQMPRLKDVPAQPPVEAGASAAAVEAAAPPPPSDAVPTEQRSQWDRIAITPNIEIHVRRPLGRLENRRVERLITIARQVLREE